MVQSGLPIDIFEEKINLNSFTTIQLLTDLQTSRMLISQFGCYQEKSHSKVLNLFSIDESDYSVGSGFYTNYRSYANILDQLKYFKSKHPQKVKLIKSIGASHENRSLTAIHITAAENDLGLKPLVWIMAGQHAREWIAPAATMHLINLLLTDTDNEQLLKDYEFAMLPLVNPDGYELSRTKDRMWRKNCRPGGSVDLNRNWDILWGEISKFHQGYSYL
jgi:carboxypeptidase A1